MSLRHGTVCFLAFALIVAPACTINRHASDPTSVGRGLRFVSHNAAFDAFFADLHDAQLDMLSLPTRERNLRKELAKELKTDEGATTNVLVERAAALAQSLSSKGTTVKLDVEGVEAVDEADTSAQLRVSGPLEGDNLRCAEAITRTARSELKLLAHLNAKEQSFMRLAGRATMLEGEVDRAFSSQDPTQVELVRRNLSDAKLLISLMDERRVDLSVESRRTVERLANAMTTNIALGSPNEPPLITFVKPEAAKEKEKNGKFKAGGGPASVRGGATKSPSETPGASAPAADFEP